MPEEKPSGVRPKVPRARAERIPEDWQPSPGLLAWCAGERVSESDALAEAAAFRDYWRGIPDKKGTKLDWDGTFRNRIREQIKRGFMRQAALPTPGFIDGLRIVRLPNRDDFIPSPGECIDVTGAFGTDT